MTSTLITVSVLGQSEPCQVITWVTVALQLQICLLVTQGHSRKHPASQPTPDQPALSVNVPSLTHWVTLEFSLTFQVPHLTDFTSESSLTPEPCWPHSSLTGTGWIPFPPRPPAPPTVP